MSKQQHSAQPYEVGRYYTVSVVRMKDRWNGLQFVPVIGPRHNDREILDFPQEHYHIDWRFLPLVAYEAATWHMCDKRLVLGTVIYNQHVQSTETRRMRCQRDFQVYPSELPKWLPQLEKAYENASLGPKRICPHRGADLSTLTPVDGVVTCPLHGLKWCANTGKHVANTLLVSDH